ncbi:MAG: hypothetical protein ACQESK_07885 [Bacteroidota bacterium]
MKIKSILPVFIRLFGYAGLLFFITQIIRIDFEAGEFKEDGLVEYTQESLLILSTILLLITAAKFNIQRYFNIGLGLFLLMHFIREFDAFFDENVFDGFWQIGVYTTLAIALVIIIKNWKAFWKQLANIQDKFPFGILLIGLTTLHVFSRLYGKTSNWESLLGSNYQRGVKDASEECIELLAYMIIFIAVIEIIVYTRKQFNISNPS